MVGKAQQLESAAILAREWEPPKPLGVWRTLGRFAVRKPLGAFGVVVIVVIGVAAVGTPVVSRYGAERVFEAPNPHFNPSSLDPNDLSETIVDQKAAPTWEHWFGTDNYGRDSYARIIWGARRTLNVGLSSLVIGTAIGVVIGTVSAYFRGLTDMIVQRLMDAFQSFPALVFLLLIATMAELSVRNLIVALGVVAVPAISRIVRSAVLQAREMPYVEAARVLGATDLRIMARHIIPNVMAPIIVIFTIGVGAIILAEASLSFLGLVPTAVSWGQMLDHGRQFLLDSPWQALFSGAAITLAVLAFNLAGDALRDVLDPRLRL